MFVKFASGRYVKHTMKSLTTSVYTFEKLHAGGFLYVDKTTGICELIEPAFAQYFLSRPRRFGKSLLISTLKAIFQGRRDLFEGLALADKDYDWQTYPVIHLDLGSIRSRTVEELEHGLLLRVRESAEDNGCSLSNDNCYDAFTELIRNLTGDGGKVVILVDEYDKPLLAHIGKESARGVQEVLKGFYSIIKTTEEQQRFVLITGVSKFSRVSIFSDLNNLTDLTMDRRAATLLGYTQEEVEANFPDYIERLAKAQDTNVEKALEQLRVWYNGYRFEEDTPTVYNPVSLMKCFMSEKFKNYWFETGTPTFLLDLLKRTPVDLDNLEVDENAFSTYDPIDLHPLPLLFQTGYLTIKGAEMMGDVRYYKLGYPNLEISQSFSYWLVRSMASVPDPELSGALRHMVKALQAGDVDTMLEHMKTFFTNVPSAITIQNEKYYQTIFFTVFKLVGAMIDAEVSTNIGRIDAVAKTADHIYIFEFKLHGTAEDAMRQIHDKQYAAPYRDDPRQKLLVGVEFNETNRNLGKWLVETVYGGSVQPALKCQETATAYGDTGEKAFASADELENMRRAVERHADAVREIKQAESRRREAELQLIKAWAPFVRETWRTWKPRAGEVIVMLYLERTPPEALRQVVKDCTGRELRSTDYLGQGTTYYTELDADPAENEQAVFPVPKSVYERLARHIEMKWWDRTPRGGK